LFDEEDKILEDKGIYLGITTNNQAEYTALKLGLEAAKVRRVSEVDVYMDSLLVVNQMKGSFKVRNRDLWPIHSAIKDLARQFKRVTFTHVPRELNKMADSAVNRALDEALGIKK
jgi:ribonuclease HI